MRRLVIVLALLAATTMSAQQSTAPKKPVAAPQTARQALIEMLTTKSDKVFEKHLPEALLVHIQAFKSKDAKTGQMSSPMKTANTAVVASKDAHFYSTGPNFITYTDAKTSQRIEVTVDRDEPTADGNNFEFGFRLIKDGKESASAFIPKVLVRMKQEAGQWRLAEIGFIAKLQLDDGAKLDQLTSDVMGGLAAMQASKQPTPAKD